jgi:hypothetical protein
MTIRKRFDIPKRNDRCPCGSGQKFKKCCAHAAPHHSNGHHSRAVGYIDDGEDAVRWVITDARGTSFFSDKDNRILVFTDKADAFAVASLSDFSSQEAGEINVASVGATKFKHLCEILPYVEVSNAETAVGLVRERIDSRREALETQEGTEDGSQDQVQDPGQAQDGSAEGGSEGGNAAADEEAAG